MSEQSSDHYAGVASLNDNPVSLNEEFTVETTADSFSTGDDDGESD